MRNQQLIVKIAKVKGYTSLTSREAAFYGMEEEHTEIMCAETDKEIVEEMCDAMAYYYQLAEQLGVDLDAAFRAKCEELVNREHRRLHKTEEDK